MKTIKVIDLLNKIANDEEVPKKIRWGVHLFEWDRLEYKPKDECNDPTLLGYLAECPLMLNSELEILEEVEEDKGVKKLNYKYSSDVNKFDMSKKIDELIDVVNELKKEGN